MRGPKDHDRIYPLEYVIAVVIIGGLMALTNCVVSVPLN